MMKQTKMVKKFCVSIVKKRKKQLMFTKSKSPRKKLLIFAKIVKRKVSFAVKLRQKLKNITIMSRKFLSLTILTRNKMKI